MTEPLKMVRLDTEAAETFLVYQGEKLVAYVIAMDGFGPVIREKLMPAPERQVRASGTSAVKSAERLDQLLEDGEPTRRLRVLGDQR